MDKQSLSERWFRIITDLSQSKVQTLEDVLAEPRLRRALQKLIENAVDMYAAGRNKNSHYRDHAETRDSIGSPYQYNLEEQLRHSLSRALSNKNIFPTTNHVVEAVNHFFGMNLEPSRFRKAGRRAVLSQLWKHLMRLSRHERDLKLRRFFETAEHMDPHRSYRELFKILSRSE